MFLKDMRELKQSLNAWSDVRLTRKKNEICRMSEIDIDLIHRFTGVELMKIWLKIINLKMPVGSGVNKMASHQYNDITSNVILWFLMREADVSHGLVYYVFQQPPVRLICRMSTLYNRVCLIYCVLFCMTMLVSQRDDWRFPFEGSMSNPGRRDANNSNKNDRGPPEKP